MTHTAPASAASNALATDWAAFMPTALTTAMAAGWRDAFERHVLFADALRQRGNLYRDHRDAGNPALLKFAHELVLDGRDLPQPCNYALLRILPPADCAAPKAWARPLVVVDPRAGHGPGIGGFKRDSEVGVALRAGHPVYFVTFRPEPEEGQTLFDVMRAEIRFLEEVVARHPQASGKPMVIGNCQAGWASALLAAARPDLVGTLMVVGSPLSYWAGSSTMNPMRYSGATLGGAWLAEFTADMAGGRFDGAHLVENFERLNPANTWWSRYQRLWANVDTEAERFLEFERWWGGYFRMTGDEIGTIVDKLFVGNQLARGEVATDEGQRLDLRAITAPVVVFASWGDNITPPPQALNWIIDTWGDERAIAAAGRTVVYVLHEHVGHLGIFVGADIARKEHDQIVTSMDVINHLPPGLYEMNVQLKDGSTPARWDDLEPGSYTVQFLHRTMDDLRAINPEGREEEQLFATVAQVSEQGLQAYRSGVQPWLKAMQPMLRAWGDAALAWHPLRLQRSVFSDDHPAAPWVAQAAEHIRAHRHALPADHPQRSWEAALNTWVESHLNLARDLRDRQVVQWSRLAFGPLGWGAWFPPQPSDETRAQARAQTQLTDARKAVLATLAEGGFEQAVCRIVVAGMVSIGAFERRSLRLARLLAELPLGELPRGQARGDLSVDEWQARLKAEARIAAVAPVEALSALAQMLPSHADREHALAVAAAVLMIEPTLHNPRSEIIELLIPMLDLAPDGVIELARRLTAQVGADKPAPPKATVKPRASRPPRGQPPAAARAKAAPPDAHRPATALNPAR